MSILSKPYFRDEQAAFDKLKSIVWPEGPTCPKCDEDELRFEKQFREITKAPPLSFPKTGSKEK